MVEARAEYDYIAGNDDELTLHVGDIITNVVQKDSGWLEGKLNGKLGLFPDIYVKVFNKDQKKSSSDSTSNGIPLRSDKKRKCRVVYSYTPVNEDELELEVNTVIDVIEEVEQGWWRGVLNGRVGVFPSNFVEEIHERLGGSQDIRNSKDSSSSESSDKYTYKDNTDSSSKDIKPKPVRGIGLGNIFQDEYVRLKPSDKKAMPPKKPPPPTAHMSTTNDAPMLPPKPVREQARVLFAYDACNDDELSLREGDLINILSKDVEDKGWWKGEVNNKIGVFPDNFVELIAAPEVKMKKPERTSLINKAAAEKASDPPPSYAKTFATDVMKRDDKPERPEKPTPPLPGKKPQLPPPLKKPQRPSAPAPPLDILTDDMKVKSQIIKSEFQTKTSITNTVEESAFDSVESSADKLTHLTATRVRNPHRRPPSHLFLKDAPSTFQDRQQNGDLAGVRDVKNAENISSCLKALEILNDDKELISFEAEEKAIKGEPHIEKPVMLRKETAERTMSRLPLSKPAIEPDAQAISSKSKPYVHLPKPLGTSKEEIVSRPLQSGDDTVPKRLENQLTKSMTEEVPLVSELGQEVSKLKNQVANLQHCLENYKTMHTERIQGLIKEIDEEKKIRLAMQVELECLKKYIREH